MDILYLISAYVNHKRKISIILHNNLNEEKLSWFFLESKGLRKKWKPEISYNFYRCLEQHISSMCKPTKTYKKCRSCYDRSLINFKRWQQIHLVVIKNKLEFLYMKKLQIFRWLFFIIKWQGQKLKRKSYTCSANFFQSFRPTTWCGSDNSNLMNFSRPYNKSCTIISFISNRILQAQLINWTQNRFRLKIKVALKQQKQWLAFHLNI